MAWDFSREHGKPEDSGAIDPFWGEVSSAEKVTHSQMIPQDERRLHMFSDIQNLKIVTLQAPFLRKLLENPPHWGSWTARMESNPGWMEQEVRGFQKGCWKIKVRITSHVTTLRGHFTGFTEKGNQQKGVILNPRKKKKIVWQIPVRGWSEATLI